MKKTNVTDSDFIGLEQSLNKRKSYVLADVESRLEKVAFDVVKFKDDDLTRLWQVQKSSDGTDIIVAMYDEDVLKVESEWSALPDKAANINVFYKGEAIYKFAASKLGFEETDVNVVCRALASSLSSDKEFVNALVREIPIESREFVLKKYPELKDNS